MDIENKQETKEVPGGEFVKSVDSLQLEVCVREGTSIKIHPDQMRQWKSSGQEFDQQFEELKNHHLETYANCLNGVISDASTPTSSTTTSSESSAPAATAVVPIEDEQEEPPNEPQPQLTVFESLEKMQESETVECKCMSEVAGVELLRTSSGKMFFLCDKDKALPRHTVLGGFGTGKYLG